MANEIEEEEAAAVTDAAVTDAAVIDMVPDSPAFESSAVSEILKDATKRKEKAIVPRDRSGAPVTADRRTTTINKKWGALTGKGKEGTLKIKARCLASQTNVMIQMIM